MARVRDIDMICAVARAVGCEVKDTGIYPGKVGKGDDEGSFDISYRRYYYNLAGEVIRIRDRIAGKTYREVAAKKKVRVAVR